MMDLSTTYLGQALRNPLVVSSSPLTRDLDLVRKAEDAGAAAFVMHSLFEEQIESETMDLHHHLEHGNESYAESLSYFPPMQSYNTGPEGYLELARQLKAAVDVPVFASLNGTTVGGWVRYARLLEETGVDGIELNVYDIPTDPTVSGADVEQRTIELVQAIRQEIKLPLAVKLSPFFSSPANLVAKLQQAGASAAILFNRFYQPDLDIEQLEVAPHLKLSHSDELLSRLHWCGIIYGRVPIELAITGGVHTGRDVIKSMMSGAQVVMLASALIRHGPGHLEHILTDLRHWMAEREFTSISQMRGSLSLRRVPNPSGFVRGNYMKLLREHSRVPW